MPEVTVVGTGSKLVPVHVCAYAALRVSALSPQHCLCGQDEDTCHLSCLDRKGWQFLEGGAVLIPIPGGTQPSKESVQDRNQGSKSGGAEILHL